MNHFNSHPHEEDDNMVVEILIQQPYFNSHPHEEDDDLERTGKQCRGISTHILTKRMTQSVYWISSKKYYFNSHPHEEDDEYKVER